MRDSGPGLLLCTLLAGVIGVGAYRYTTLVPVPDRVTTDALAEEGDALRIDPNIAPWWELTAMPGIGEVTAKRIVEYRDTCRAEHNLPTDAPVFQTAAHMQRVKGIGPKKFAAMEPYLVFPASYDRIGVR